MTYKEQPEYLTALSFSNVEIRFRIIRFYVSLFSLVAMVSISLTLRRSHARKEGEYGEY